MGLCVESRCPGGLRKWYGIEVRCSGQEGEQRVGQRKPRQVQRP